MDSPIVFSVVVPTFNRPQLLGECLSALASLDYPRPDFEVIVADDGGNCDLDAIVAPFAGEMNVRLLRHANRGPGGARNLGAAAARGRFLAFTDDDCRPSPAWLRALEEKLTKFPDRLAGGRTVNALEESPCAVTSQLILDHVYAHFNRDLDQPRFFATNNIAVPAAPFHEMGGFDEKFTLSASEDREFCDAWQTRGWNLVWAPEALVHHRHAMGLREFWRQQQSYGRGALQFRRARIAQKRGPVPFEGVAFHVGLFTAPFREKHAASPFLLAGLTALSQVAVVSGYLSERIHPKIRE